jgi:hypothetical protein
MRSSRRPFPGVHVLRFGKRVSSISAPNPWSGPPGNARQAIRLCVAHAPGVSPIQRLVRDTGKPKKWDPNIHRNSNLRNADYLSTELRLVNPAAFMAGNLDRTANLNHHAAFRSRNRRRREWEGHLSAITGNCCA